MRIVSRFKVFSDHRQKPDDNARSHPDRRKKVDYPPLIGMTTVKKRIIIGI